MAGDTSFPTSGHQMPALHQRPQDTAPTKQAGEGKSGKAVGGAARGGTPSQAFSSIYWFMGRTKGKVPQEMTLALTDVTPSSIPR